MHYKITVFTPTFNRAHFLFRLYKSLKQQAFNNFEWIIVDDGSIDNTKDIVLDFIKEGILNIRYHYQKNSGKHIAINKGLDLAQGEWFFIVDSDDFLISNALIFLNNTFSDLPNNIQGVVARRGYNQNEVIGDEFKEGKFISDHIERRYINKLKGDLAEVYKTELIKNYKFPVFSQQKFCAEGLIWNRIAKKHKSLFISKIIYITEYLENGLSANSIKNRRESPDYAMLLYKELSEDRRLGIRMKARTYINYWRFSFFSNYSFYKNWMNINKNFLALLLLPLGFSMMIRDNYYLKNK